MTGFFTLTFLSANDRFGGLGDSTDSGPVAGIEFAATVQSVVIYHIYSRAHSTVPESTTLAKIDQVPGFSWASFYGAAR